MDALDHELFEVRSDVPSLGDHEVHVWYGVAADAKTPRAIAAAARATLERLLRAYVKTALDVLIERDAHGKPFAPQWPQLEFNLSHAGANILLAFARGQALGVDLEHSGRRVSWDGIAQRFFSAGEAAALRALSPAQQVPAFLRLWTHKEAVLKALGQGLAFGLHRVQFALDSEGCVSGLIHIAPEAGAVAHWCVHALAPAPGLIGALAWRGTPRSVRTFSLSPR